MMINNVPRRLGRYPVADDRFSVCGKAFLNELDWGIWIFAPKGGAGWLFVRERGAAGKWHKVRFKRRRRGMPSVMMYDGELCWLVEEPKGESGNGA